MQREDLRAELGREILTRSVRRAAATTRAPSAANLRATAAPKPLLAPVTKTVPGLLLVIESRNRYAQYRTGDCQSVGSVTGVPTRHAAVNPTPVRVAPSAVSAVIALRAGGAGQAGALRGRRRPARCRR